MYVRQVIQNFLLTNYLQCGTNSVVLSSKISRLKCEMRHQLLSRLCAKAFLSLLGQFRKASIDFLRVALSCYENTTHRVSAHRRFLQRHFLDSPSSPSVIPSNHPPEIEKRVPPAALLSEISKNSWACVCRTDLYRMCLDGHRHSKYF